MKTDFPTLHFVQGDSLWSAYSNGADSFLLGLVQFEPEGAHFAFESKILFQPEDLRAIAEFLDQLH